MAQRMKSIPKLLQISEEVNRKMVFDKIMCHLKNEKIIKQMTNVVKMCFLIDATGSMRVYIEKVRETIKEIVRMIKEISNKNTFRLEVAYCFYRDITDEEKVGIQTFTTVIDFFEESLGKIKTYGGDDQCEDVLIGFQAVNEQLDWNQDDLNFIFWIADAPCHGIKYHKKEVKDNYPNTDRNKKVEEELKKIAQKNIYLFFLRVNSTTDMMIDVFNQIYKKEGLKEIVVKNVNKDMNHKEFIEIIVKQYDKVQQTSSLHQMNFVFKNNKSIYQDKTLSTFRHSYVKNATILTLIIDHFDEDSNLGQYNITVDQIENTNNLQFSYTGDAIIKSYQLNEQNNALLECKNEEKINISISQKILSRGSFKLCFYAQNNQTGDTYALKQMFRKMSSLPQNILFEVYINQLAKQCLKGFQEEGNKCSEDIQKEMKIFIPDLRVVEANGNIYLLEKLLESKKFKKFINNDGSILHDNDSKCLVFESFIHYSYHFSGQNFIFTDLQGVNRNLVDIGISSEGIFNNFVDVYKQKIMNESNSDIINSYFHQANKSLPKKIDLNNENLGIYCPGNQSLQGIISFFQNHKCNHICKALKLHEISYQTCKTNMEAIKEYFNESFEESSDSNDQNQNQQQRGDEDESEEDIYQNQNIFQKQSNFEQPQIKKNGSNIYMGKSEVKKIKENEQSYEQQVYNKEKVKSHMQPNLNIFINLGETQQNNIVQEKSQISISPAKRQNEKINGQNKKKLFNMSQTSKIEVRTQDYEDEDMYRSNKRFQHQDESFHKYNKIYGQKQMSQSMYANPNFKLKNYKNNDYEVIEEDDFSKTCDNFDDIVVLPRTPGKLLKKIN